MMNDTDNTKDCNVSKGVLKHTTPPPLGEGLRERASEEGLRERALTVFKASAGSGKTFTLAVEYIKLLVKP